ncbi:hypothetical protein NKH77_07545 [Streptomyces sp. M19]
MTRPALDGILAGLTEAEAAELRGRIAALSPRAGPGWNGRSPRTLPPTWPRTMPPTRPRPLTPPGP